MSACAKLFCKDVTYRASAGKKNKTKSKSINSQIQRSSWVGRGSEVCCRQQELNREGLKRSLFQKQEPGTKTICERKMGNSFLSSELSEYKLLGEPLISLGFVFN